MEVPQLQQQEPQIKVMRGVPEAELLVLRLEAAVEPEGSELTEELTVGPILVECLMGA
jgi:hypothetical protein